MNFLSDSQATHCSEVEELMKSETNNSCCNVSVRRSQRLSQKRLIGGSIFEDNCCISVSGKDIRKYRPRKQQLQKTSQDVFATKVLRLPRTFTNLACWQQKVIEKEEPLNLSMSNKRSANDNSIKTLNENVQPHLSCSSYNDDIALQYVSVQDFQQNLPIQNFNNEIIRQQSNPSKTKGRPRKTYNKQKENNKKRIECLAKNKEKNMNFQKVNARTNEMEYGKKLTYNNTQNRLTKSILPDFYPPHFKHQLPPEAVLSRPLVPYPTIITPENTPSYELEDSSSTSPSLPDSLRGIFDTDDIKEILNIDKVSYRLCDYHVQALAAILNLRIEYLFKILDKILQMDSNVLKNFDKAKKMPFVEDRDLFETTPDGSPTSEDIVHNSQSPKDRNIFTHKKISDRKYVNHFI